MKRQFLWPLLLLVAAPLAARARAQTPTTVAAGSSVTRVDLSAKPAHPGPGDDVAEVLQFDDLPLPDAIQQLAVLVGMKIQFDPKFENQVDPATHQPIPFPTLKEKWRRLTPAQALDAILCNYGWEITQTSNNPVFQITAMPPEMADLRLVKVDLSEKLPGSRPAAEAANALNFDGLPLRNAIGQVASLAGLNVQFDPRLTAPGARNPPISARWKNVTPTQALDAILSIHGWQIMQISNNPVLRITAMPPGTTDRRATRVDLLAKTPGSPGDEIADVLNFDNLALQDAIMQLAGISDMNVQLDPRLTGPHAPSPSIAGKWKRVTPKQALEAILSVYRWQITQISNNPILQIAPMTPGMTDARVTIVNSIPGDNVTADFTLDGMALPDAVTQLSDHAGINIQFDPVLTAPADSAHPEVKVTKKWKNITAGKALLQLLDENGWQLTRRADSPIFRVETKRPDAF